MTYIFVLKLVCFVVSLDEKASLFGMNYFNWYGKTLLLHISSILRSYNDNR